MTAIKWILLASVIIGLTALIAAFDTAAQQSEYVVVGGLLVAGLIEYHTSRVVLRKKSALSSA